MKSGYIFGFAPTLKYLEASDKAETWTYQLMQLKNEKDKLQFTFVSYGDLYKVSLIRKSKYLEGIATVDGDEIVTLFFNEYSNERGLLLIGSWTEDKEYTCIVELSK
jgi:hypothetical protein